MLLVVIVLTSVTYYNNAKNDRLPVLKPTDVNPELVDPSVRVAGSHTIADFELLDQRGKSVDNSVVDGKIYVADFFFSTCQTICPIMTGQMSRVATAFQGDQSVKFMSFSVLPDVDVPEVLNAYADKNKANYTQWKFITGDKKVIYELARKSYFTLKQAEVGNGDGGDSDFIHTNNFVLVDTKGQIRGYYDGTSLREVDQLIEDIELLKKNG